MFTVKPMFVAKTGLVHLCYISVNNNWTYFDSCIALTVKKFCIQNNQNVIFD